MGTILRRGAFVGRRVYEVGHYTTISRAEMSAIFDEAGAALRAEETARLRAELEANGAHAEADAALALLDEALRRPEEGALAHIEESTPASAASGLNALASLRAYLEEHGTTPDIESALSTLGDAVQRAHAQSTDGADEDPPASTRRGTEGADDSAGGDNGEPPTSCNLPLPLSHFALRDDGTLLLSLEDAAERDITGREVIAFMVLSAEEAARARAVVDGAFSEGAARIIASLPRRPT
jgi:hypothetical protein